MLDINELVMFMSMNNNLTLQDLLDANIAKRLDEFFNKDKEDIDTFLKQDDTKNLSKS
jgi:hypothetical protein